MPDIDKTDTNLEDEFIKEWIAAEEKAKAPAGKFKLVVSDHFDYSVATIGVFDTLADVLKARAEHEREEEIINRTSAHAFNEFLIYDEQGFCIEDSTSAYSMRKKNLGKS